MKDKLQAYAEEIGAKVEIDVYGKEQSESICFTYKLDNDHWARNDINITNGVMNIRVWSSLDKSSTWDMVQRFQQKEEDFPRHIKEAFFTMMEFWNFILVLCKDKDITLLTLTGNVYYDFGEEAYKRISESKFVKLNHQQKQLIQGLFKQYQDVEWIVSAGTNELVQAINLSVALLNELNEKQEADKTMVYDWELKKGTIQLYYQGTEKTIKLTMEDKSLQLSFDEQVFHIAQKEDAKNVTEELFTIMASENPVPKKHFTDYCKVVSISDSIMEAIHSHLLQEYSIKEIEEYAVQQLDKKANKYEYYVYANGTQMFVYLQSFIVVDEDNKQFTFYKEKESAVAFFKDMVIAKENEQLEKKIQDFSVFIQS